MSFAIFDESFYLSNNPDVRTAVNAGIFSSGLQHFQQFGLAEGRVLVSPLYNEGFYLRKHPDVAASVASGAFRSGLQHYIQLGEAEGRDGTPFSEQAYLIAYPDVAAAVDAGAFSSGLQHYVQYGQVEEDRIAVLFGTSGNDIITGFGESNRIISGVAVDAVVTGGVNDIILRSRGVGEVDTLIGAEGTDLFSLGFPISPSNPIPPQLYVGGVNTDYALIQNFERLSDAILLAGSTQNYNLQVVNGSLNISTASGDLVGIVEGVTSLLAIPGIEVPGLPSGSSGSYFILA